MSFEVDIINNRDVPEHIRQGARSRRAWKSVADREEEVLQEAWNRAMMDPNIQPRDKILLRMRTEAEGNCRRRHYDTSAYCPCSIRFPSDLQNCGFSRSVFDCLNTTAALYILDDRQFFPYVCGLEIEIYLWRQWFRPYTTDIDALQQLFKIYVPKYDKSSIKGSEIGLNSLIALHCCVFEQTERLKDIVCPGRTLSQKRSGPLRCSPWKSSVYEMDCSDWQHTTIIQPLFRALFMVLVYPDKLMIPTEPRDMSWVPNAQVQLILTGITEGLSAPISFDELREYSIGTSYTSGGQTITTTLSIATEFILHLEQREIAAFGIQPNTCSLPADALRPRLLEIREEAKKLGWVEERDGSLDDLSPRSSEWVDRTIFPTWLGDGAIETLRTTQYRIHDFTKTQYTEDWWWNPQDLPDSATRDVKVCKRITEW